MSALRPTAARLMPRMTSAQPFAQAPPAALASRQAERLELLVARPHYKPRISDPPLPPRPYPSPLNAPLRPGRKAQRSAWLGPEDGEVAPPQAPTWVVNPLSTLAAEAAGREPDEWFVRRVEHSGFMPVYTDVRRLCAARKPGSIPSFSEMIRLVDHRARSVQVSRGGDRVITIVRKVEGNATVSLCHALVGGDRDPDSFWPRTFPECASSLASVPCLFAHAPLPTLLRRSSTPSSRTSRPFLLRLLATPPCHRRQQTLPTAGDPLSRWARVSSAA